uniref:Uncharacterized protein n=1 Tax=viral metagenome TaxID=1070528 RepID=A0A6C0BZM5_9ZZZZ
MCTQHFRNSGNVECTNKFATFYKITAVEDLVTARSDLVACNTDYRQMLSTCAYRWY